MAQKPIREAQAKELIDRFWEGNGKPVIRFVTIGPKTDLYALPKEHPWLEKEKLVLKADELFGKRKKRGYIEICEDWNTAKSWIQKHRGTEVHIDQKVGTLNHFLVEPFIEHTTEYYLSFDGERGHDVILFSQSGGINIEEQAESPKKIEVSLEAEPDLSSIPEKLHETVTGLFSLWRKLDLGFLEINPLVVKSNPLPSPLPSKGEGEAEVFLLDTVCRVDTCAKYKQRSTWGSDLGIIDGPDGFGSSLTLEEEAIAELDAKTGASLKFVLLNPKGRIWTMVAGGGASMIYADAITDHAPAEELANYGEWSGNPSAGEMEEYAKNIFKAMFNPLPSPLPSKGEGEMERALIIGGGIANFTDIEKTFAGIIAALEEYKDKLQNIRIYVRRAGPNDQIGLKKLQDACDRLGIWCVTHDAEMPMTQICQMAMNDLHLNPHPNPLPQGEREDTT